MAPTEAPSQIVHPPYGLLWTPWRYRYVTSATKEEGCIFCQAAASKDDAALLVVWRGKKNFIILNRYPYTSGHSMVVPYAHESTRKRSIRRRSPR